MEKTRFTTSDVLELLFSDFSGSNSEGEDVYAYRGPTVSDSILREEENLYDIFSGKWFL